ncbi:hypothetical protein J8F10_05620 [Gemmata sp. G18]|uniref:Uncharacterized protein n=1 Tax=Gemmata palustris TaxID=2822762 RepID=A0ABS5BM45_9BACT|nr:hypothetical protein [Gemmata palustris]MBP3954761.1 hypothetical protein [Gemmata palustris]
MSAPPNPGEPPPRAFTRDEAVALLAERYRVLVAPGQVVELRALRVRRGTGRPHTEAGFFDADHLPDMARAALDLTDHARGVYFTLNPLAPDLLARRANRTDWAGEGELARDRDVTARRWLLVDADPVRDPHISATGDEKARARETAQSVRTFLRESGWPDPVLADSGNGFHLLYRVDLPADDGGLVKRALGALAAQFDTPAVTIDRAVHNPGRICKLPGTFARKGDSTPTRPHRRAKLLEIPDTLEPVPLALLQHLATDGPAPEPPPAGAAAPSGGRFTSRLMVDRWLADRGLAFRTKPEPDARGRTVYVLAACPFDPAHAAPDACVMQAPNGQLSAHCFHNGCIGHGWHAFKQVIGAPEPHHYDPPLTRTTRGREKRAERPTPPRHEGPPGAPPDANQPGHEGTRAGARPEIVIEPATTPVARTMCALTDVLIGTRECYHRAGQLVRVTGTAIKPVLSAPELAGLLNHHAEVLVVGTQGSEYKPLPVNYANTWLNHPGEAARLPAIALFTQNPVFATDWRLAPPGFDPASGIYYAGPAVEPRAGTEHLDALLTDFCFRTPGDRTNYLGVLLTTILMPHFVGSKPAVLFAGNQPGLGKTVLAQVIATLRDGRPAETATYNPNDEEFEKRLGAVVHRGATTIIVDNAKGKGRAARIDSACLERSITDATLSFRLLGHSREIRAENSHIFCLTANTPEVSRDLVTRCALVDLFHEGDPARRAFTYPDPEGYARDYRAELLGELVGMVARWRAAGAPEADVASRFNKKGWGRIVGGDPGPRRAPRVPGQRRDRGRRAGRHAARVRVPRGCPRGPPPGHLDRRGTGRTGRGPRAVPHRAQGPVRARRRDQVGDARGPVRGRPVPARAHARGRVPADRGAQGERVPGGRDRRRGSVPSGRLSPRPTHLVQRLRPANASQPGAAIDSTRCRPRILRFNQFCRVHRSCTPLIPVRCRTSSPLPDLAEPQFHQRFGTVNA